MYIYKFTWKSLQKALIAYKEQKFKSYNHTSTLQETQFIKEETGEVKAIITICLF